MRKGQWLAVCSGQLIFRLLSETHSSQEYLVVGLFWSSVALQVHRRFR
jgi:hypothetical protein